MGYSFSVDYDVSARGIFCKVARLGEICIWNMNWKRIIGHVWSLRNAEIFKYLNNI